MCGRHGCNSKSFAQKDGLEQHVSTCQRERVCYSCPDCDRQFVREDLMRRHYGNVHVWGRPSEEYSSYTQSSDIHSRPGSDSSGINKTKIKGAFAREHEQAIATENDISTTECAGGEDNFKVASRRSSLYIALPKRNVDGRRTQSSHDDQERSPSGTHTAEARSYSTRSSTSGADVPDSMDGSSDDFECNCASDIVAEKEQILDRLMVCVYDMFTSTGSAYNSYAGRGSHQPKSQAGGSSVKGSANQAGIKRKRSKGNGDDNLDDEENDGFRKRHKGQKDTSDPDPENHKLLACPYYKCNPRKVYPSKKCYGPGWDSVHRLKYSAENYIDYSD
jgi:hypothetical protein